MKLLISTAVLATVISLSSFISRDPAGSQQNVNNTTENKLTDSVFNSLIEGNRRFASNLLQHPHQDSVWMHKLSTAQHPKAIVLTCADSRVSPEIIFDQGLGDLFVIRNAGNVVDADVLGSMEYAIEHLGVRTVIVLGHESCGAVQATVKNLKTHNHIMNIEKSIRPAFKLAEKIPGDSVHNTVVKNVELSMKRLNADKTLVPEKMDKESVNVYGAVYDLKTGKVTKIN